jgi:dipeptidyl aminopeptidase/acylaminoacyl peptidase
MSEAPPTESPLADPALEVRPFRFEDPGERERVVRGRLVLPRERARPLPHVLVVHGFKGFMDWGFFPPLQAALARAGLAALAFNLSGSGVGEDPERMDDDEGFERNTHSRELEDLARVRALVLDGAFAELDPSRAAILGHSRGGALALLHAAEDGGYRAVVTWAAVADLDRYDEPTRALWRAAGRLAVPNARTGQIHRLGLGLLEDLERNRARLDVLAACRRLKAPCLLVHGGADESVPSSELGRLAGALGERARTLLVPGAGHTFEVGHPWNGPSPEWSAALEASLAWLGTHLA